MANVKIDAQAAATQPLLADELPINEAGTSKKITLAQIRCRLDEQSSGASAASVTLTVPTGVYKVLHIYCAGRSDQAGTQIVNVQFNADGGANYDYAFATVTNVTQTNAAPTIAGTSAGICGVVASGAAAGVVLDTEILIFNADSTSLRKAFQFRMGWFDTDAAANSNYRWGHGQWRNAANAITSIKFTPAVGNLVTFRATLYGEL